jgi:hypothetical protein
MYRGCVRRLFAFGGLVLLVAVVAGLSVWSAAASSSFPRSIYPPPVPPSGKGSISFPGKFACPNPAGVAAHSSGGLLASLNALLTAPSEPATKAYADQAAWPIVAEMWSPHSSRLRAPLPAADVRLEPASGSFYASIYEHLCGTTVISRSWTAIWCLGSGTIAKPLRPSVCLRKEPALTHWLYFLYRRGHWLLWGVPQ